MTEIIKPGAGILFMKVGTHAQEPLEDIIARKTKEIEEAGFAMWGYGGGTCHPQTMVQPFAKAFERRGEVVYLCMEEMESSHFALPVRADQFSVDGHTWQDIPPAINVRGSRYALLIDRLLRADLELPLSRTRVAIGTSHGRAGDKYVVGRVDKACLEVVDAPDAAEERRVRIGLVARVVEPYAVFVKNVPRP